MAVLLLIVPLCSSAIGAGCFGHIGLGAGMDEQEIKDHLLVASHKGHDVTVHDDGAGVLIVARQCLDICMHESSNL